jgi:hypothetical protein
MRHHALLAAAVAAALAGPAGAQETIALRPGNEALDAAVLATAEMAGAPVYGPGDEQFGSIATLVIDPQGKVEAAIVELGGFLGLGARQVALPVDQLSIQREGEGGAVRVYSAATPAELEAMPEFR